MAVIGPSGGQMFSNAPLPAAPQGMQPLLDLLRSAGFKNGSESEKNAMLTSLLKGMPDADLLNILKTIKDPAVRACASGLLERRGGSFGGDSI